MPAAVAAPAKSLLSPTDHTLILIDHQSQMALATKSIAADTLRTNPALIARAAAGFKVSTILTSDIARKYGGAYGTGPTYAKRMFSASEGH